ncbi:hypothetical protein COLO4_20330 [Corchorus olitorius]|uniref:Uncharacterized protein n=1 Tax=Corchorus olitorius TaxID=93759 RepID=A0A1R3J0B7_9ROSI|nr:hypothetical protein COLO4_20330 [Corchorus olitorius]
MDNRFVVAHNVDLCVRYNSHINVEICSPTAAIKYLFKYIHKGPDRARVVVEHTDSEEGNQQEDDPHSALPNVINEIKLYLDCRYVAAHEACWRLFEFDIHFRQPSVQRLLVHLPGEQKIYFHDRQSLHSVLARPDIEKTMFTEWFEMNKGSPEARTLLYIDFPTQRVWHKDDKIWTRRQQGQSVGRIISVPVQSGELFYLRLLLNVVRGPRSYEEIRTVGGVLYPTFQRACETLGLLGDDREWQEALTQSSFFASSHELRHLFVLILLQCEVSNPSQLFERNWRF